MTLRLIVDLEQDGPWPKAIPAGVAEDYRKAVERACKHSLDLQHSCVNVASVEFHPVQPIPF